MKSRIRQFLTSVMIAAMMAVILPAGMLTSYAADGRIAFSDKTAAVGSEVDINMKITVTGDGALSNATVMLSYDSSMLEFISGTGASGGAGSVRITVGGDTADAKELSSTLKFKVIQAGSSKISVNTQEVYDSSNQVVNISQLGSSAITAQAPANASTEASLSGLQVSPGTLTPEFSPDVFVYTASVGEDVTKITIDAPAKDEKASVVLSGNEDLQPGENRVVCRVVAEDGTTMKEYVITVTRAGDGTGTGEGAAEGSIVVETPAKNVTIIPLDEGVSIPDGFAECTIKIDGQDAQGWIWATDTEHKYCVFYGMNENGEKDFYRYDLAEKTMQRYFQDPTVETNVSLEEFTALANEHNSLLEDYKLRLYIIIGLGIVAVILLIMVIVLLATRRRDGDDEYTNYEEKLNDRREPVRRASEGLPSQRAKAREAQMREELARESLRETRRPDFENQFEEEEDLEEEEPEDSMNFELDEREAQIRAQEERLRELQASVREEWEREARSAVQEEEEEPAPAPQPAAPSPYGQTRNGQTTFVPKPIVAVAAVQRPPIAPTATQLKGKPVHRPVSQPTPMESERTVKPQPTFGYEMDDEDDEFELLDLD